LNNATYKTLCGILLIIILVLVAMLFHDHFVNPEKPVWRNFMLDDTTHVDSLQTTPNH
jgi:hypothetical protein